MAVIFVLASVAIISLVLSFVPLGSGFNLCALAASTGLYSCTLLVMLNSRIRFKAASFSTTWQENLTEMHIPLGHVRRIEPKATHRTFVSNGHGMTITVPLRTHSQLDSGRKQPAGEIMFTLKSNEFISLRHSNQEEYD